MKYNFIGISFQKISGINNPLLTLIGTIKDDSREFKVLVDGKEIEFDINFNGNDFILKSVLTKNQKIIEVYYFVNDNKYLIYRGKNTLFRRLKTKLSFIIKNNLNILKAFLVTLFKGIKFLWKEYHFLVPPKLWKKYFNDFKNRIRVRGVSLFYNPFNVDEYNLWLNKNEFESEIIKLNYNPLISILIPV